MDKINKNLVFLQCDCMSPEHAIRIDKDDNLIVFNFYVQPVNFWNKIKTCLSLLSYGYVLEHDFVLRQDDRKNIIEFLSNDE